MTLPEERQEGESPLDWALRRRNECNANAVSDEYKKVHGEEAQLMQAGRAFAFSELTAALQAEPALGVVMHVVRRDCGQIGPDEYENYSIIIDVDENDTMGSVVRKMMKRMRRDTPLPMHLELEVDV